MVCNLKFKQGLTLVEVLVAAAIILTAVVTLIGVHSLYLKIALTNGDVIRGAYLAEEGIEAMRFLRDSSWIYNIGTLTVDTDYGVTLIDGNWQTSVTDKWVGSFERTISLSNVYRDSDGDIVTSGGTLDPDAKLLVSSVSWPDNGATTTKSISTYLTNLYEN